MSSAVKHSSTGISPEDLVAEVDTGGRMPTGAFSKNVLFYLPLIWTLFQLWYASPLPFIFNFLLLNDTEARAIHLAFAIFLSFVTFPTLRNSPRNYIPIQDWICALLAAFCAAYIFLFYEQLSTRPGLPTTIDLIVSVCGIVFLLEATRRALGPPLMIVAAVFMTYTFAGPFMPSVIAHKGASLAKGMSHYWLGTEGVFGVALGVSTSMVFMFVLFGSLLEAAGAGNYFIRTAFAGLGHMKGGPAKAAVVSSALTGLVSGSSIANVVTTGTFTIPLMKKVGFTSEKAGAVEVASSTNGQLTPPVMGAAAFLMVEYVGISYIDVIKHAFLPAVISYIALVYIVHLEACKMGLKGLPRRTKNSFFQNCVSFFTEVKKGGIQGLQQLREHPFCKTLLLFFTVVLAILFTCWSSYHGLDYLKVHHKNSVLPIVSILLFTTYIGLLWAACRVPDLPVDQEITELPPLGETAMAGVHYLLPIVVLMWCLVVERLSPALSAFWATVLLMVIILTQYPLKALFRKQPLQRDILFTGCHQLIKGMVSGAKNMIGIGVATSTAGLVVGTVTLTGIGLVMTEFVELISGGNLMLILLFTAFISLILGMGLPTTANYIVVSSLMAPVIVSLGAQNGLIVPLVAVHLFVFYFGILADDTPPVGLAAFAAAGISGGDPIRTGIQGFTYDIRTAILPFIFIFNNELLMIGISSVWHFIVIVVTAIIAMLVFAAGTQGWFVTRNRWWESIALLLIAFTLFRPGFFWDKLYPPLEEKPATELITILDGLNAGEQLRLRLSGEDINGDPFEMTAMIPVGNEQSGAEKLAGVGIETREEDGKVMVDSVAFTSPAEKAEITFDQEILSIQMPTKRLGKEMMFLPALALLWLIWFIQRRRVQRTESVAI